MNEHSEERVNYPTSEKPVIEVGPLMLLLFSLFFLPTFREMYPEAWAYDICTGRMTSILEEGSAPPPQASCICEFRVCCHPLLQVFPKTPTLVSP